MLINNPWGQCNEKGLVAASKVDPSIEIVGIEKFENNDVDMVPQLTRLKDAGADAIILVVNAPPGAQVMKSRERMGWTVPVVSHWGISGGRFPELAGPTAGEAHFVQTYSFFGKQRPVGQRVLAALQKKYPQIKGPEDIVAPVGTANAYDAMHILALAIAQAGSTDADAVRAALGGSERRPMRADQDLQAALHPRQSRRARARRLHHGALRGRQDRSGELSDAASGRRCPSGCLIGAMSARPRKAGTRVLDSRLRGNERRISEVTPKRRCMLIATAIISGLGLGSMYGLLALGFHVTHAVSRTVNFAQGSTMMLGAVLCFTFWVTFNWPLAVAVVVALAACALWGVMVERVAVRPFVVRGSNSWLIATVALGIVLDNVVLFTFGKDPRGMPPGFLTTGAVTIAGVRVQYLQMLIPVIGLLLAAGLQVFFATSRHGKALLAVVQNRDAARLMGIRVERVVEMAFALSGLLAGIAGILVAPLFTISSTMGTLFGIKAFAVAILGGIESAWGVVLAGLIYGVAEALITALLGSTYTQIVTFALVILALAVRPNGLFGRAELRKV